MINKIKYKAHLIIHSKYKLLIHLFILSLIYLSFYSPKMVLCMMEDGYTPDIAENKSSINQTITAEAKSSSPDLKIRGIIQSYLEPAREIEELRNALEVQQAKARNAYDAAGRFQKDYWAEAANGQRLKYQHQELIEANIKEKKALLEKVNSLQHQIKRDKDDYETQIAKLMRKINRQKMEIRELKGALSEHHVADSEKY